MKSRLRSVLYGIAVWAVPFGLGMLLFPIQDNAPELFDTMMTIALCFAAVSFGSLLAKRAGGLTRKDAVAIGFVWVAVCILIDLPVLVFGLGMDLKIYVVDVGMTYLVLPIILFGLAVTSRSAMERTREGENA